ncbi:MAG TPA: signal peptidase I [Trebonia sp.]|jgi:signal peptidase I|nr:signal peptidase I [Trebonia sp.]
MDAEPSQAESTGASSADTAGMKTSDISLDSPDGTAGNGSARNGAARNGAANDGTTKGGAAGNSAAGSGAAGNSAAEGSSVKDGTPKDGTGHDRAGHDGAGEDDAAEDGPGADDAGDGGDGADAADSEAGGKGRKRKRSFFRELVVVVVAALVLTILIKAFLVQVFSIPSASMENTLQINDRILVNRLVYHLRGIDRGDVVVFSGDGSWGPEPPPPPSNPVAKAWDDFTDLVGVSAPGTDYVKRVIGLPGDHVACCTAGGQLTVNGVPLSESSYLYPGDTSGSGDPRPYNITVPPGRLFVLGDHRSDSADSRYHFETTPGIPGSTPDGTIPENEVVGRAFVIIWPTSRIGDLPIPNTFKQPALQAAAAAVTYGPAATAGPAAAGLLVWRRKRARRRAGRSHP